jgi:hypothetical protein
MSTSQARDRWWSVVAIGVAIFAAILGSVLVLAITAIATFIVGPFSLVIPLGALVAAGVVMTRRKGEPAEWCPECGGVLSPAVIQAVRVGDSGQLRLRAEYTCAVLEHRSWRWADTGEPLRASVEVDGQGARR